MGGGLGTGDRSGAGAGMIYPRPFALGLSKGRSIASEEGQGFDRLSPNAGGRAP
jgi:hypothetical protein